jgi:hypothetical protein
MRFPKRPLAFNRHRFSDGIRKRGHHGNAEQRQRVWWLGQ